MRLSTVILLTLGVVLLIYIITKGREHFGGGGGISPELTVSWQPPANYPTPSQLQYTWAICYDTDLSPNHGGSASVCSNLAGKDPSTWPYSGTTKNTNVALNANNCTYCMQGQVLTFMLMAQDTVTGNKSAWMTNTIDLTSTNPSTVNLTDQNGKPIYVGAQTTVVVVESTSGSFPSTAVGYYQLRVPPSTTSVILPLTINGSTATSAPLSWSDPNSWFGGNAPDSVSSYPISVIVDIYEPSGVKPTAYSGTTTITPASAPVTYPTDVTWALS
jgi:hypothetical protein